MLRQETRFPDEERTRLTLRLERPLRLALRVRQPAWATQGLIVEVNGTAQSVGSRSGAYATIEREWRDGDVVDLQLPMGLRLEPTADDPSVVALFCGPVVLAADLGTAGLDDARRYGPPAPELKQDELPQRPALVAASASEALARIRPAGGALSFRTQALGRPADVELRPFFRLHDRRYTVYFDLLAEKAYAQRSTSEELARRLHAAREARSVDHVRAGVAADETAHQLEQKGSDAGWFEGRSYRAARSGGGFGYALRGAAGGASALHVTYWGGESRRHQFEVLVEGQAIARQSLFDDAPGEPFSVEYPVPERLARGRERLRVGFRPLPGSSVGAVFELRLVRPAQDARTAQP